MAAKKKAGKMSQTDAFIRSYIGGSRFHTACDDAMITPCGEAGATYYVYVLVRTDIDEVVYVGKGKGKRMHQHVKQVATGTISGLKKYTGIKALISRGIDVLPYRILEGMPEWEALRCEKRLIDELQTCGIFNGQDGSISRNERLMLRCKALMSNIATKEQLKRKRPNDQELALVQRRSIITGFRAVLAEIRIAQNTGYSHTDKWDAERIAAREKYLAKNPAMSPPSIPELPLTLR